MKNRKPLVSRYRCASKGQVNNGLKESCEFEFKFEDFELVDYDPYPHIKAAVSPTL